MLGLLNNVMLDCREYWMRITSLKIEMIVTQLGMICVDDASLHRHRKLGICIHDSSNGPDIGLQARIGRRDQFLASWHHQKFIPFCLRWKDLMQCFGSTILFLVSILVVLVIWVSQMASAEFTDTSFLFLSLGDFGSGTQSQNKVAEQMAVFATALEIKFVTGLGDNFYETGITDLQDEQLTKKFEEVYKDPYLTSIPWFMALGDHDHCGKVTAQVEYSQRSPIWRMPALYFVKHIHHGQGLTLDLVITDSVGLEGALLHLNEPRRFEFAYNKTLTGRVAGIRQLMWLENTLQHSSADWVVVIGHRPLYSVASRHRYPVEYRLHAELMPLFKKYGVDMYLHGHDHVGQHSIRDGMVHIGNGVGGYGNQPIRRVDKKTVWSKDNYHGFCIHHVTKDHMVTSFIDSHGKTLHEAMIQSKKKKREADQLRRKNQPAFTVTVI